VSEVEASLDDLFREAEVLSDTLSRKWEVAMRASKPRSGWSAGPFFDALERRQRDRWAYVKPLLVAWWLDRGYAAEFSDPKPWSPAATLTLRAIGSDAPAVNAPLCPNCDPAVTIPVPGTESVDCGECPAASAAI
jgi:hypothetical protein